MSSSIHMSTTLITALLFVLFPVGAMITGGVIASFRQPGTRLGSAIQHFAAGTVFAAVAVELLPDVVSKRAPIATTIGFACGVALMLLVRRLGQNAETMGKEQGNLGLVLAVAVDITIDGFLIGIGFVAGAKQGLLLTIALTLELLSLGLATVTVFYRTGTSRGRSVLTIIELSILPLVGATVGITLLSGVTGAILDGVLAFGVAALLYLVAEELLVEAHEVPETTVATAFFFAGFLIVLIIDLLV